MNLTSTLYSVIGMCAALVTVGCGSPDMPDAEPSEPASGATEVDSLFIRVNLFGYEPGGPKSAIVFGDVDPGSSFSLVDLEADTVVFAGDVEAAGPSWGRFAFYGTLTFSQWSEPGTYYLRLDEAGTRSSTFAISDHPLGRAHEDLLGFMRQQRCGYNPFLDRVCHQHDGRTIDGPRADSTYLDASGGWHDAGDQLKYLITSSNAVGRMLLAFELEADKFGDYANELGQPVANGLPDVLDEARWGAEWILKLHPRVDELYHQVADDRDHVGWKWPYDDPSDYGWGPNSYRATYFATGRPQGRGGFLSEATGIGNLAGRSAAALAMAARIWREHGDDEAFADRCERAASSLYALGKANEGFQQGNSYGAPYRYTERTWADDMEWAAAEMYKLTRENDYLVDARGYARLAANDTWMPHDTTEHYQYYPFVNVAHFVLYPLVDSAFQDSLAAYYRAGLDNTVERASRNAFGIGVPFIWCSNNLTTALVTQGILYERMTGDDTYREHVQRHFDWLLGRNPWGTSMFTGLPRGGEYPVDVHTSVWAMTGEEVPGGLVDGPVYGTIYRNLRGLELLRPDEFGHLQNTFVVYHDDIGDYSTNEPTMDGTAGAIMMMAHFGAPSE